MCDLTLISKDGMQLSIEKFVASEQSGLFKAYLESDDENEIVLERIEGSIYSFSWLCTK